MNQTRSVRHGFTLVEILVVIVIIAVLASTITLFARRALQTAREAHGTSNLKQVVSAALTYAADQNGRLPYVQKSGNSFFYTELGAMVNGGSGDGTWNGKENYSDIFKDPSAPIKKGESHFTMTQTLAKSYTDPATKADIYLTRIDDPSNTVIFFDGSQVHNGNAEVTGWKVDNGNLNDILRRQAAAWFGAANLEKPVAKGANSDTGSGKGDIRWRNQGNTAAKFGFVDGSVRTLRPEEVKRKFFMLP